MIHRALQSIGLAMLVAGLTMVAAPLVFGQASADPAKSLPASERSGPVDTGEGYARMAPPSIEALRADPDIVIVDDVNLPIANTLVGSAINWVTGVTCNCDTDAGFNFNAWSNNGNLAFWWWGGSNSRAGLSLNGTSYAVLGAGDTIGPASTFMSVGFSTATVNWRQADNVDGYLGFRFDNAGTVNYGYVRLTTTGTTGFPATIVSYAYNRAGGPITIPSTTPEIEVSPASFEFTVEQGGSDTGSLQIANVGGVALDWDIEFEPNQFGPRSHDPALDEVLAVPDFTVVPQANGGTPEVFTLPAGVLTSGGVVGFSFEGTVAGITGNEDWASNLCLQIEGPDGSSFSVGGLSATIPNCNVNSWDFQGSGSTNDGTYASVHDDVWPFPPGAQDQGDWTLTFIHGWDSIVANPMDWSNVTVTLHKLPPPEPCDFPAAVSWLSVDPTSGSTAADSADAVEVTVDSDGLAPGDYSANLCINSNDPVLPLIVVPVHLVVEPADLIVTAAVGTGQGDITPPNQVVSPGANATFTVTPVFGWSVDSVVGDTCTPVNTGGDQWLAENIVEDCAVEASFLINTYTVTASVGSGEGTVTPPSQLIDHGSDATFTVTPETGWSLDSVTGDTCTPVNTGGDQWLAENIVEDCAVEANFLINTYTVAASAASGEGSITPPSQLVDHGSDATFTVTPATGWSLDSVVGDTCTPGNTGADQWLAENIVEDCAVEASFLINTYTLGGTVSGLEGSGLVLSLDDVETLSIAASGAFTFLAELDHGTAWSVSVETQPAGPAQTCSVSNGSSPGITGDVDNISVVCSTDAFEISGTIAGLTASGLVLNLNGSESLPLGAGSTSFQFADAVADGSDYLVRVETQPDGQWCEVSDGQGTVSGGPVEDVRVSCSDVGISLSLTDINFGFVILGVKETRGFTVSNPGTNPLIISGITSPGSPFSIISNSCSPLPRTLNAGESCMVAIELDSGTLGDFEAEILITSNAQDSPQAVTVRGAIISPLAVPLLSPLALLLLILMLLVAARVRIRSRQKA